MRTTIKAWQIATCGCALTLLSLTGCGSGVRFASGTTSGTAVAVSTGPQLGYFWNVADQTLRPVLGIAGSSQIGASVVPAGVYTAGAASAASGLGVLQEADGSLDVLTLPDGAPAHLKAATATGALIRFSPLGRAALVFVPGASSATVITALGTTNAVSQVTLPGPAGDAVLSDSGHIALTTASAGGSAVMILVPGAATRTLGTVTAPGGLAFAAADSLVYADAGSDAAYLVRTASSTPTISTVPSSSLLKAPAALSVSANGRWLAVTNSAEASVVRLDLSAQLAPLTLACACTPSAAVALSGNGVFRITEPGKGPVWAADLSSDSPRIFFIPALP